MGRLTGIEPATTRTTTESSTTELQPPQYFGLSSLYVYASSGQVFNSAKEGFLWLQTL